MLDVQQPTDETDREAGGGRRLPTLVLDRETIRNLTPQGSWIEAIGKKKPKKTEEITADCSQVWPTCGDTPDTDPPETEPIGP